MYRTRLLRLVTVFAAVLLTGCEGPYSVLDPSGPSASAIATLWWLMLWGGIVLFLLVLVLLSLVVFRPNWGSGLTPGRWVVMGGLVLPAIVLLPLVAYALFVGEQLTPPAEQDPIRINVTARQWTWVFNYPGQANLQTENVMHVPAGVPVDVMISSDDVIHSFWVPQLAGKMDAIPGKINRLRIQATEPGRYLGLCTEFCGVGHAAMRFDVIAHPPEDYAAALARAVSSGEVDKP